MTKETEHDWPLKELKEWDKRQMTHRLKHSEFMVVYQTTGKHSAQTLQNSLGCSQVAPQTLHLSRTELWWEVWKGREGRKSHWLFFCPGTYLAHEKQHWRMNWGTWTPRETSTGETHLDRSGTNQTTPKGNTFIYKRHQEETSKKKTSHILRDLEWGGTTRMGAQYRKMQ